MSILKIIALILVFLLLSSQKTIHASNWMSTYPLPDDLASSTGFSYGNNIYVLGGANSTVVPNLNHSTILNNGQLTSWTTSPSLSVYWHSSIMNDNKLYILGGQNFPFTGYYNTVYLSTINNDGSLQPLQSQLPLPNGTALGNTTIVGEKIYYAGGFDNTGEQSEIYVANINPSDGSLSNWKLAGQMPDPLQGFGMITINDKFLILGGNKGGSEFIDNVRIANLDSEGSITSWTESTPLPERLYRAGIVKIGEYVVIVGGLSPTQYSSSIYYTRIKNNNLTEWEKSPISLPYNNCCAPLVATDDYLYLLGGYDGYHYQNNTLMIPINEIINRSLAVPIIKQTDPQWMTNLYDSANIWSPSDTSIGSWGCALTSASMVLQYHGIQKLPDNTSLNPASLNSWLKNQPDGYIANGSVNWIALTRLSRLAKISGNNPNFTADALEYNRLEGANISALTTNLQAGNPVILEEPGHFVVAKGMEGDTFSINDPFFNRETLDEGYDNTFLSMGTFSPSFTDLSYILVNTDKNVSLMLKDSSNIIQGITFLQQPLTDADNSTKKSGYTFRELLYPKPNDGEYKLSLSSSILSQYNLTFYLYDSEGNIKKINHAGYISNENTEDILISFKKANVSMNKTKKITTFDTFIRDIDEAVQLKDLNSGIGKNIINIAKATKKLSLKNRLQIITNLDAIQLILDLQRGILVRPSAYTILSEDIVSLKQSL